MVMTLNLNYWETLSLSAGCNLYTPKFSLCVLAVRATHRTSEQTAFGQDAAMYFRERDKPVVPAETFLATAVPKLLMGGLIVFLNVLAIVAILRTNRRLSSSSAQGYALPASTLGLLSSLFVTYLLQGLLTLYSQVSLSAFLLADVRLVTQQGEECLVVNSLILALSLSTALHLVSLGVDRTLASYLSHQKYTALSRGTVPLWLLSIWLPSLILGALPIAGWRNNFSFCVFLLQFNDDYLRFLSGFFLSCLLLIPLLYVFFFLFLRKGKEPPVPLYRWHRKLQAHHRLTFALVLAVNTGCWTPFHIYLLLACQTCPYAAFGSGFTLEYLFILALVPAFIIPLMFSLRSSFVDKCGDKLRRCVSFRVEDWRRSQAKRRPLPQKSPLFFINDLQSQSSSSSGETKKTGTASSFFVPHYLPSPAPRPTHKFKASFKDKYDSYRRKGTLPLRNFCAYLSRNEDNNKKEAAAGRRENLNNQAAADNTYDSLESDFKYGFPIIPTHHNYHPSN